MSTLLLDSNVLIDYLRGRDKAVKYLESRTEDLVVSAVTVAELHAGARNQKEKEALVEFLTAFGVFPVCADIASQAGAYRAQYGKSHGVDLIDALIAATAARREIPLVTCNRKHFPMLKEIRIPYRM